MTSGRDGGTETGELTDGRPGRMSALQTIVYFRNKRATSANVFEDEEEDGEEEEEEEEEETEDYA